MESWVLRNRELISRRGVLIGGLAGAIPPPAPSREAEALLLESERWRIEFSPSGAVSRFIHVPSGAVLLESPPQTPAYEVRTPAGVDDNRGAEFRFERVGRNSRQGLRFRWDKAGKVVAAEVTHSTEHGGLEFRVRVENRTATPITAIRYPVLVAPLVLGQSPEDDVILLPQLDGGIVEKPAERFGRTQTAHSTYPGPACCQITAFYDATAGLYVAAHDSQGHGKSLGASRLASGHFDFTIAHLQPREAKPEIVVEYPIVVDTFQGDWYAAAEKYREWSLRQAWASTRLWDGSKVPRWIRNGAVVAEYDPTSLSLDQQRVWFETLRDWFHVPIIPNNRGWERHGMWAAAEYLPPRPSPEEFQASAKLVRKVGGRGMIMLSGYRWTLEKPQPDGSTYSSQERFDREIAQFAQCTPNGTPRIWTSSNPKSWTGTKWVRLCRATEFAKRLNLSVARYSVESGYPVIHWDQENCGAYGTSVCYCAQHGHPPGDGQWLHREMEDLYRRFHQELAPLSEDFLLSMEEANELYVPYLTMSQQRPFANGLEWPAVPPMTEAVPLFMFLHHEHVFGWAAYYPWRTTPQGIYYSLAKGFSYGLMPGLARGSHSPSYISFFQRCIRAYQGYARQALMYGRMMRPLLLDVERVEFQFRGVPKTSVPTVVNSVWRTPEGRTVIVLINHTTQDRDVGLNLAKAPGWPAAGKVSLLDESGRRALNAAKPELKLRLPAHSCNAIEF